MYIEKCIIRNIKCFQDSTLDFCNADNSIRLWNVIIGEHGTGKTTLLQAIAMALLGEKATSALLAYPEAWIHSTEEKGAIHATIRQNQTAIETASSYSKSQQSVDTPYTMSYEIAQSYQNTYPNTKPLLREARAVYNVSEAYRYPFSDTEATFRETTTKKMLQQRANLHSRATPWFAAGYGPFRRFSHGSERENAIAQSKNRESCFVSLFREDAALVSCVDWLMQLDYISRDKTNPEHQKSILLLETLYTTLDVFLPEDIRLLRINSQGVFFQTSYAEKVPLSFLSSSYRAMLTLIIDLIRNMSRFYNPLKLKQNWLEHVSGVVLIDELDAHMHPTWQRTIPDKLKQCFPKVQFIVTTHSPFIAQAANDNGLFTLRNKNGVVHITREEKSVRGWRADQILSILFQTASMYDSETEEQLREHAQLQTLADIEKLSEEQEIRFAELDTWVRDTIVPLGDTRTEMHAFRALDRRVEELSMLFQNQEDDTSRLS